MIQSLYQKIRQATEPNNPDLIKQFLDLSLEQVPNSIEDQRNCMLNQYQLLIDTLADEYLPAHWRTQCLDHIYIPLFGLQQLADTNQAQQSVRKLFHELRVTCNYVQAGLTH